MEIENLMSSLAVSFNSRCRNKWHLEYKRKLSKPNNFITTDIEIITEH